MISMPQPTIKQQTFLVPLLGKLRQFNTGIGNYISSSMLLNFNYHLYLIIGKIIINSTLFIYFIKNLASIARSDYQAAATQFVANGVLQIIPATTNSSNSSHHLSFGHCAAGNDGGCLMSNKY